MADSSEYAPLAGGVVRAVVRPYASSLPLGFFSFGVGMLLLAAGALGWTHGPDLRVAGILLAAFVFPLEFLACVVSFLARDTATAATLGLFSTSWLALGTVDALARPGSASAAVGVYLVGFTVMVAALAVTALPDKPLLAALLVAAALRSVLSGAYQLGGPPGLDVAAGIDAVLIFAAAVYLGLAFLLEDTQQRAVLPTLRRGAARQAIEGDIGAQISRLHGEAGIRRQL